MNRKQKKIFIIVFMVSLLLFSLLALNIVNRFRPTGIVGPDIYLEKAEENTNRNNKTTFNDDVIKLRDTYKDVKAWIKIPGTEIDYPVFQGKDNKEYINKDRDGHKYKWGEVFLDYRSDISNLKEKEARNTIIYGHNTTRDSYFTELLKYKKPSFFEKNKYIYVSTKDKNYKFQVVSAYETSVNFYYIDTKFDDKDDYAQFLYKIEDKSMHSSPINIIGDESLLTLSTCIDGKPERRFVVHAILVK